AKSSRFRLRRRDPLERSRAASPDRLPRGSVAAPRESAGVATSLRARTGDPGMILIRALAEPRRGDMRSLIARLARAFLFTVLLLPVVAGAQAPAPTFTKEQLDQMVAPIALYPDSLLSQVLMAATYPADVAEAAKWSKANPNQSGDAAVKAVASQPW